MTIARCAAVCVTFFVGASSASAAIHLVDVNEVFPGTAADATAQYIEITLANQSLYQPGDVAIYDAGGNLLNTPPALPGGLTTSGKMLLATTSAAALFGITADVTINADIATAGGRVCFRNGSDTPIDCVSWGNYSGDNTATILFGSPLQLGQSVVRSGNNFLAETAPVMTNNAGTNGDTCGNGLVEAEVCDGDGAGTGGESANCDTDCTAVSCGDSVTNNTANEDCDNGASNANTAACKADCTDNVCGDGYVGPGEACDGDGNGTGGVTADCTAQCAATGCGDGAVTGAEQCDDQNQVNTDACLNTCLNNTCGDGFVNTGVEQCDDTNTTAGDGCSATCMTEGTTTTSGGGCAVAAPTLILPLWVGLLLWLRRRRASGLMA